MALQALKAVGYYVSVLALVRFAGKRLAGQTTTFDLIILITLGVVIQNAAVEPGAMNALVFVATLAITHKIMALLSANSVVIRDIVRGKPRELMRDGRILDQALAEEGMTEAELRAGLRNLGCERIEEIKVAVLE